MILNAYSIYDRKALQYHPPFYASTDGAAARSFSEVANDLNTSIGRHPADFVLYCVGTFSDDKATLTPVSPLRHVIDAEATISIKRQGSLFDDVAVKDIAKANGIEVKTAAEILREGKF